MLLAGRVALGALQVVEELLDVRTEAVDGARRNEAKHLHAAVIADKELPGAARNVDGARGGADGVDVAESPEPDKDTSQQLTQE